MVTKPKNQHRPFRLRDLIRHQRLLWMFAWLLGLAMTLSILGLTMLSGWFISMAAVAGLVAVGSHTFNYMVPAAVIRGFAIIRTMGRYGDLMVSHHAVFGLLKNLRVRFFSAWAHLSHQARTIDGDSSSAKMHRLVADIDVLNEFVLRMVSPWMMAVGSVLVLSLILLIILPAAWAVLLLVVLSLLICAWSLYRGISLAKAESNLLERKKTQLLDTLPALTQLLLWQQWQDQEAKLVKLDESYMALTLRAARLRRLVMLGVQICLALACVLLLYIANQAFTTGTITPFSIDTLNGYGYLSSALVLALLLGVIGLGEFIQNTAAEPLALGRSLIAKSRLNALIKTDDAPLENYKLSSVQHQSFKLQLESVVVKAPKALLGISVPNALLTSDKPALLVGASGAGKSTLLHTLAQEYAPVAGMISLNVDGNKYDWQAVDGMGSLGFLGQQVDIFDQTLADNLRLGKPDASDDELYAVLEKVGLAAWVSQQPSGLATPLGEYGMAVSGGQARRIALARLLLSPKQVLLLDEPFAGLDSATREKLWQTLSHMHASGEIGLLIICTHQLWAAMDDCTVIKIG